MFRQRGGFSFLLPFVIASHPERSRRPLAVQPKEGEAISKSMQEVASLNQDLDTQRTLLNHQRHSQ
jgi:hypothetical protein